jgi:hypothetical protein
MRPIVRHTVAWAATAAVVAVLPGIAADLAWRLDAVREQSGGVSFYVWGWRSSETTASGIGDLINPFSPGPLVLLLMLLVCCLIGERVADKHRWLRWAYPGLLGIAVATISVVATAVVLPADLPRSVPLVVGVSTCAGIGLLACVYWGVLRGLA